MEICLVILPLKAFVLGMRIQMNPPDTIDPGILGQAIEPYNLMMRSTLMCVLKALADNLKFSIRKCHSVRAAIFWVLLGGLKNVTLA